MILIRNIVSSQCRGKVNRAAKALHDISMPAEGWIYMVRKALSMSAAELARRLGRSRALVSNTEKAERAGGVTLRTMQNMSEALGCRFVYAIVPEQDIELILERQADRKARQIVEKTSQHMALEAQQLSPDQISGEIRRVSQELLQGMPSDFWKDRQ